ncbi:hypothetical protein [Thermopirellula anaerolimosa]
MDDHDHQFVQWRAMAFLCIPIVVTYVLLVPTVSWIRGSGAAEFLPAVVAALGCLAGAVLSWGIVCQVVGTDAKMWAMVLGFLPRTIVPLVVVAVYSIFVERLVSITAFVYCIVFYPVALVSESWLTINSLRREGLGGEERDPGSKPTKSPGFSYDGPACSRKE